MITRYASTCTANIIKNFAYFPSFWFHGTSLTIHIPQPKNNCNLSQKRAKKPDRRRVEFTCARKGKVPERVKCPKGYRNVSGEPWHSVILTPACTAVGTLLLRPVRFAFDRYPGGWRDVDSPTKRTKPKAACPALFAGRARRVGRIFNLCLVCLRQPL
jgi:hypothetical protein